MSRWQDGMSGLFYKVVNLLKDSPLFSSDTFSKQQIKAGLFKFSEETNGLMEGYDQKAREARTDFLKNTPLEDHMGHDELFSIIEKLELHMRKSCPYLYPIAQNQSIGGAAYNKSTYITENIKNMSEKDSEDYAHKYDRMIGVYKKPSLIIDNTLG